MPGEDFWIKAAPPQGHSMEEREEGKGATFFNHEMTLFHTPNAAATMVICFQSSTIAFTQMMSCRHFALNYCKNRTEFQKKSFYDIQPYFRQTLSSMDFRMDHELVDTVFYRDHESWSTTPSELELTFIGQLSETQF
ncbi:hypothetical protein TNCV_3941081 [Trichonephila clavipes]|uniref:Uncharacterized protein n=1 Tax=Trichonephila clavipes TaxID=2585209 RepID=A0A8X6VVX6_TRICX|nr:hypothetical protein TNCV_3941081 [Trichonephila clavipes]